MTLENTLLERLSEWQPPAGRQELFVAGNGWNTTVTADRSDVLGCLTWELQLQSEGALAVELENWAKAAADRVTGLMEPLKVVEVDTTRKLAQLRSEAPLQRGKKKMYYELMLSQSGNATLRRFAKTDGAAGREQVAFAITHEALAKVAYDVAEAGA